MALPKTPLKMVGAVRFELTTSCTRNKRATSLRYAPTTKGTMSMSCASPKANFLSAKLWKCFAARLPDGFAGGIGAGFPPPAQRVWSVRRPFPGGGISGQPINLATDPRLFKLYDRFFN